MNNPVNTENGNRRSSDSGGASNVEQNNPQGGPVGKIASDGNGSPDTDKNKCDHTHKHGTFEVVTRILEIGIGVVIGAALVVIGWLQYSVYDRQADIMRVQTGAFVVLQNLKSSFTEEAPKQRRYFFGGTLKNTGARAVPGHLEA
jgi:hypothetical protein